MHKHSKFVGFLESITTDENKSLMESIKKGYDACMEGVESLTVDQICNLYSDELSEGRITAIKDKIIELQGNPAAMMAYAQKLGMSTDYGSMTASGQLAVDLAKKLG